MTKKINIEKITDFLRPDDFIFLNDILKKKTPIQYWQI